MKNIIIMNQKAQFAVNTLKLYAEETGNIPRGTTDISPLEEWLILRLFGVSKRIFDDLNKENREHIQTGGLRYSGVSDEKIKQVFEKFGYINEPEF